MAHCVILQSLIGTQWTQELDSRWAEWNSIAVSCTHADSSDHWSCICGGRFSRMQQPAS